MKDCHCLVSTPVLTLWAIEQDSLAIRAERKMSRIKVGVTAVFLLTVAAPELLAERVSENHLLKVDELKAVLVEHSSQRQVNILEVQSMLRHEIVQEQVGELVDLRRIEAGIESLDDETLAQLAEQSREIKGQLGAGISSWVYIIAVGGALLVILLLI
jgi:hypothetical protein